jgi:DNA-binding NarL/FixJ family response regulator
MKSIKVLIADDVSSVRQDLRTLLTLAGNIEIAGEAADGTEAIHQANMLKPDVVLMDLEMPVIDGLQATRRIKTSHPDCRVIVLTIHSGESERQRAFSAGADNFLEKGTPLDVLLEVIYGRNKPDQVNES